MKQGSITSQQQREARAQSDQRACYACHVGRQTFPMAKVVEERKPQVHSHHRDCEWWIGAVVLTRRLEAYDGVARPSPRRAGHRVTPLRSAAGPGTAPALSSRPEGVTPRRAATLPRAVGGTGLGKFSTYATLTCHCNGPSFLRGPGPLTSNFCFFVLATNGNL